MVPGPTLSPFSQPHTSSGMPGVAVPAPPWQLGTHLWSVFVHRCGHSHRYQFSAALPLLCQSWPVCCHFSLFHEQFILLKRNYSRRKDWYADLWRLLRERLSHLRYTRTKALDKEKVIISPAWRDKWEIKCPPKKNVKQLIQDIRNTQKINAERHWINREQWEVLCNRIRCCRKIKHVLHLTRKMEGEMPEVKTMYPGVDSEKLETLATSPEQVLGNLKSIKTVRAQRPDETHFRILKEMADRLLDYRELSLTASLKQLGINRLERNKQSNGCRKEIMESYELDLTSKADKVQEIISDKIKKTPTFEKHENFRKYNFSGIGIALTASAISSGITSHALEF